MVFGLRVEGLATFAVLRVNVDLQLSQAVSRLQFTRAKLPIGLLSLNAPPFREP